MNIIIVMMKKGNIQLNNKPYLKTIDLNQLINKAVLGTPNIITTQNKI